MRTLVDTPCHAHLLAGAALVLAIALTATACGGGDGGGGANQAAATAAAASTASAAASAAATARAELATTAVATPAGTATAAADTPCDGVPTASQAEGPFYSAGSPETRDLIANAASFQRLTVTGSTTLEVRGRVLTTDCEPVAAAWLDFWQTDVAGNYDNSGYELRGHQFANASGEYLLRTVMPAEYPGRSPHIHVKVRAPDGPVLTTQIYFAGEAGNARDGLFDASLLMEVTTAPDGGLVGTFDFVLPAR